LSILKIFKKLILVYNHDFKKKSQRTDNRIISSFVKIFFEVFEVAGMGGSLILEYLEERKLVILQKFKEQPKTGFGPA
jgi:tRNA A22 N-methylase